MNNQVYAYFLLYSWMLGVLNCPDNRIIGKNFTGLMKTYLSNFIVNRAALFHILFILKFFATLESIDKLFFEK